MTSPLVIHGTLARALTPGEATGLATSMRDTVAQQLPDAHVTPTFIVDEDEPRHSFELEIHGSLESDLGSDLEAELLELDAVSAIVWVELPCRRSYGREPSRYPGPVAQLVRARA